MHITRRAGFVGAAVILVLLAGIWMWSPDAQAPVQEVPTGTTTPQQTETPATSSVLVYGSQKLADTKIEVQGTATFKVDGTSYELTAPEGASLKDAMDRLQTETDFTYEYKDYTGLGAFVTAVNNRASTGDTVWILYVNGKKAATGISSTRIRSGDLIEWKLEESY